MDPITLSATAALLLDKTAGYLVPKAAALIEKVVLSKKEQAEADRARELVTHIAGSLMAEDVLVAIVRCDPTAAHGLRANDVSFTVELINVAPVVIQVGRCEVSKLGIYDGEQVLGIEPKSERKIAALDPGKAIFFSFEASLKRLVSKAMIPQGRAVHADARFEIDIQGPANHLCCTIKKTAQFWMRCYEDVIWEK